MLLKETRRGVRKMSKMSLIDKMILAFLCSVATGAIAWVTLVKFVSKMIDAGME